MSLKGKGLYIWKVNNVEGGDPAAIAQRASQAGLSHVLIKVADGSRSYNPDLVAPIVPVLKDIGVQVWGWQYVYGNSHFAEADIAVRRVKELSLDGFVVNAEVEYKNKPAEARAYMESLRSRLVDIPVALSSFRYPSYHREFPWSEFLSFCDINMPQVYWLKATNPAEQLDRSLAEFETIYPALPIIPTGAAYAEYSWRARPAEIKEFLQRAQERDLSAANFWSWDYAGSAEGADLWRAIATYDWPVGKPKQDLVNSLFDALNRHDVGDLVALYHPNAVHVTPRHNIGGRTAIRKYYRRLFNTDLPGARFQVETRVSEGYIRHVRWDATASNGKSVSDGYDTIALRDGLIQYHSSIYRIR
jgi:ketosteroid isomerase-like protein